jgi:hypothetical protein
MTVRINKPQLNIRDKLNELDYGHVPYDKMPGGSVIQMSRIYLSEVTFGAASFVTGYTHRFKPKMNNSELIHHFWAKTAMNNTTANTGHDYRVIGGVSSSTDADKTTIIAASWQNYFNRNDFSSDYYPPCDFIMSHKPETTDIYDYVFQGRKYAGSQESWTSGHINMSGGPSNNGGIWVIYEVAQ